MVGVSWYETMAYCRWWTLTYGKQWAEEFNLSQKVRMRLPTEAEWEFVARGYEGRMYPWGKSPEPQPEYANFDRSGIDQTTSVGSYTKGATPDVLFDIAGNVWEWCYDWYGKDYYSHSPKKNPTGPKKGEVKVLRGGSWSYVSLYLRCAFRYWVVPRDRGYFIGFRCARA